jgi:hypothetical protein
VTGGELAAAMQRNATAAIVNVSRVIVTVHITLSLLCGEQKRHNPINVKFWEVIADNLKKAGWSWGCVSGVDATGRTVLVANAHRDDGKWNVVRADSPWPWREKYKPISRVSGEALHEN